MEESALKKIIKDLNTIVQKVGKEENKDTIITNLQILSTTEDLSVFEANNIEGSELYISLYELLTDHSSDTELVWGVVKVLGLAVQNPNARSALVHTYHFIHPLTTLLDSQLTRDRKSAILNIIQELSFGVVISWQEAHLSKLLGMLVDLIMDEDGQLTPLALGVLVNLLHNNKPAIYTLMDCVDIKKLIRKIVNLQRDNVETSVQVCKLLMVLDHLSGNLPDAEILTFVKVSFIRIKKAFMSGNLFLMRHIVHFFRDAKNSKHGRKVLLTYPNYQEEINKLVDALKSKESGDWQCVQQLVEFLQQLVDLELADIVPLFTRMTQCLSCWLQVDNVAPTVLQLFSMMLRQCRLKDKQEYNNMCSCLEGQLQMFVEMLHRSCNADTNKSQVRDLLVGLLHLFHELNENPNFCSFIAANVDKEAAQVVVVSNTGRVITKLLLESQLDTNFSHSWEKICLIQNLLRPLVSLSTNDESKLLHHPLTIMCVEVLSFISELSSDDKEWLFIYSELLLKKHILKILAIGLYSGTYELKKQVLYLAGTTSFSSECLNGVAKYLTDLNQLFFLSSPAPAEKIHEKTISSSTSQIDFAPRFSKVQNESLNSLIAKLEDLCEKNKIQDASLAGIIELYNYKLTEMRRAERSLQSSLEAADKHRTQLCHRVAQLSAETGRLHQLLYASQQSIECNQAEAGTLREQLRTAHDQASSAHLKFKQLKQDVCSKTMIIKEQSEEISKMKNIVEEQKKIIEEHEKHSEKLDQTISELKLSIKSLEAEKSDLKDTNTQMKEKLMEKEMLLGKKSLQVQTLEQEISKQLGIIKGLEKTISEKDKELMDLERTRKLIFEISGGKKNKKM